MFFLIKEDLLEENTISEIDKVKSIVYSIDRKIVMFDTQFLQKYGKLCFIKMNKSTNNFNKFI